MSELFDLQPSESPKLKWMKRHHIKVVKSSSNTYEAIHGMTPICKADTEDHAIVNAAKRLNIRLWNEE